MSATVMPVLSLEELPLTFRNRLKSMYSGELQPGNQGMVELDKMTRISEPQGMWIYETWLRLKPRHSLEIGLAYGFSTIYILAAMDKVGTGYHTALDPFQNSDWHGVGALQAKYLGMEPSFQMLEEFSVRALPRFSTQKEQFELIYIDGNHKFDDVLVDFTLAAQVCPIGGNIILDDMWMPSIQTVVSWIRSNRKDFREIQTPINNIAQFERISQDTRGWEHFVQFWAPESVVEAPESIAKRRSIAARIIRRVRRMLAN
jgi:predicted O-methyltransferase YrrM